MEKKYWFVSDTHFGHQKEFLWGPRGFKSSLEHDEAIIHNWNSVVDYDDDVYVLGDFMLGDNDYGIKCINRLAGKIHLILGNHDTENRAILYEDCPNIVEICNAKKIKIGKNYFWLCHYPTITANYDDDKPWAKHLINIYGHTHQQTKFYDDNPYMYCVCLDAHNNYPVSLEQILEDIKNKKIEMERK